MFSTKVKEQAALDDPWDINPTVTYRHLLSKTPVVYNPLRVIALCDNDAFYASAERIRLGLSEDAPLGVQQWQALIAVSYAARAFGISRMDTVVEAKKKCPDLIAVHTATFREGDSEAHYHKNPDVKTHKVSLDYYRQESKKIVNIYRECLPAGGELEKASIDECFFDFTIPVRDRMLERFAFLAQAPSNSPMGIDTPLPPPPQSVISWDGLGNVIPVLESQPAVIQGRDENIQGVPSQESVTQPRAGPSGPPNTERANKEHATTWGDIALCIGAEFLMQMRMSVKERLGYTTSAGIARNKVLAKLVASYKKRDQQSILRNAAIPGFWRPMPFQKIRFLGGKLGDTLFDEMGVKTVGELEFMSLTEMQRRFGEESIWVWNVLRGVDHTEISDKVANKSMLSSKNIRPAILNPKDGDHWIRVLSGDLATRLNDARVLSSALWPKTLSVGFRQDSDPHRSRQCAFPFVRELTAESVVIIARKLWRELTAGKPPLAKIIHISIAFHGLSEAEAGQQNIEGFFGNHADKPLSFSGGGGKRTRDEEDDDDLRSFICPKCSKRIRLPRAGDGPSRSDQSLDKHALAALRVEHEDWHFAKSLARQGSESAGEESLALPAAKKKKSKTKEKPQGIAKYFAAPNNK